METRVKIILLALLAGTGCQQIDSYNIPTDAVEAQIRVTSFELGSDTISTTLKLQGEALTYFELGAGEQLYVASDGYEFPMFPAAFGYQASLPQGGDDRLVQVAFLRSRFGSALDSYVSMPPSFSVFAFGESDAFGDRLAIEWDVISHDPISVSLDGPCMHPYTFDIGAFEDIGSHVISAEELPVHNSWLGQDCRVQVSVDRVREGELDPALSGGFISATQTRTTSINIYR
jgi:hypothetical protein